MVGRGRGRAGRRVVGDSGRAGAAGRGGTGQPVAADRAWGIPRENARLPATAAKAHAEGPDHAAAGHGHTAGAAFAGRLVQPVGPGDTTRGAGRKSTASGAGRAGIDARRQRLGIDSSRRSCAASWPRRVVDVHAGSAAPLARPPLLLHAGRGPGSHRD